MSGSGQTEDLRGTIESASHQLLAPGGTPWSSRVVFVSSQILTEAELGTRLMQRTARDVVVAEAGMLLRARGADIVASIGEAVGLAADFVSPYSLANSRWMP